MSATHGGKGSKRRPTDHKKFGDNWERIFGKKKCAKCGGEMKPGKYIQETVVGGVTLSAGGPGVLTEGMKCSACGWTVS